MGGKDYNPVYNPARTTSHRRPKRWLSGLKDVEADLNVDEGYNIGGSIVFKKLMMADKYGLTMYIAKKQVEDGPWLLLVTLSSLPDVVCVCQPD
eukprot:gene41069-50821_t